MGVPVQMAKIPARPHSRPALSFLFMVDRHYAALVENYARLVQLPLPEKIRALDPVETNPSSGPLVLIASPHPDDECLAGLLALRLRREVGARILNVAFTLGSKPENKTRRTSELERSCKILGFDNQILGLKNCRAATRVSDPEAWFEAQNAVTNLLLLYKPALILCPHLEDAHPAHVGTALLIRDALRQKGDTPFHQPWIAEYEYWHPHHRPNLLLGAAPNDLALIMEALAEHRGEVARNNYASRLPAWMIDNVRRGSERIRGSGSHAPDFPFGILYHLIDPEGNHLSPRIVGPDKEIGFKKNKQQLSLV
ncbi:MAG: PIG-L deacetylase family protein [Puniceicoccaceae bacterium]